MGQTLTNSNRMQLLLLSHSVEVVLLLPNVITFFLSANKATIFHNISEQLLTYASGMMITSF